MQSTQKSWLPKALLMSLMIAIGGGIGYWYTHKDDAQNDDKPFVIYKVEQDQRDIDDVLQLMKDEAYALISTSNFDHLCSKFIRRSYDPENPSKDGSLTFYAMREKGTNQFMGFLAIHLQSFIKGRILFLAIKPEFRGRRLAGEFVRFAFKKFKEMGLKKGMLCTRTDNTSAQKAYEREGFKYYMTTDDGFVFYEMDV